MLVLIILCSYTTMLLSIGNVNSAPRLSLTSSPPSNGPICPGPIQFTCMGTEVASVLMWKVNGTDYATVTVTFNGTLVPQITKNPLLHVPGVEVIVASVSVNQDNSATIDIQSTLRSEVSVLTGSTIQCSAIINSSEVHVRAIAAPPSTNVNCSLVHTTGGPEVSIQWSPSFISQYNVEMYHVAVSPTTPSCPSSQMISASENYSCSGLVFGTYYSFNVSAVNCGNQEGTRHYFTVQPQVPRTPEITVLPVYDKNERLQLNQLTVQWMQQSQHPSERCSFNQHLSYTVVLEDSTRERVDQRMINSDNCSDNLCSISFPLSSPDQNYFVSVNVTGAFGSTSTSTFLNTSIPSSFDVSFSSEGCVTSIFCFYPMREGDCFFKYGRDSSYQDLNTSLSTSLNSPLQITVSDAATIHYYQVTINTSSLNLQVRGNFTSSEGARLTSANQGLLVVGVILLSVAIILGVIITWMIFKKGPWLSLSLSMTGLVVAFISLVLWVAVGFHVGLQKSTCDPTWQSSRDGLIISAHVFSDISLLIFVAAGIYFAVDYISLPNYKKRTIEQMSFWQKCLHRSLSNNIQHQPRKNDWEYNLKDKKLEELELGVGGRVKELEDQVVDEFRKPGQSYMEARMATQERYYQEYKDELPTNGSKGEEPASKGKGEDSHYHPLDHGKGGRGHGHKDKPARESGGGGEEYSIICASGVPSSSQVHGNKEEYQRLDFKNGAESKDKSSSTQGKSVEEYYSALGKSKESGKKTANLSPAQACKEEGEHYHPLDHRKGDTSGHKDKPSGTVKGREEEYSVFNQEGKGATEGKPVTT